MSATGPGAADNGQTCRTVRKSAPALSACIEAALAALAAPAGAAVVALDGEAVCRAGAASPGRRADAVAPLQVDGREVARLELYRGEVTQQRIDLLAPALARALQAVLDVEESRRAIATEALDGYRERAMLYRAADELNRLHQPAEVAGKLLHLLCDDGTGERRGVVFTAQPEGAAPTPLAYHGTGAENLFARLIAEPLFPALLNGTTSGILNEAVPDLGCLLSLPLMAHERRLGLVVIVDSRDISAGDLKRGITLGSMAATALRNAQLIVDLRNSLDRAEAGSRAKSDFLAHMSHELRTPLNAVIGYAELMAMEPAGTLAEAYHLYLTSIQDSGRHLLRIVDALLDLSRLERGELELRRTPVAIADVIEETLAWAAADANEAEVRLEVDTVPQLPALRIDADRIRQALQEVLRNAIRYSHRGGTVTVSATLAPDGGVSLCVRDRGAGLPVTDTETLFQPFRPGRDPLVRSDGGIGLGLPLSKRLIELHGGDIRLESQPDQGTAVFIRLPGNGGNDTSG